ncbi:MAG: F0F1 ATP synthase subunit delta [Gammaproteobacteria bacterium]|nr:F0F1 ATP synthase subunit delta [Gammaproteobacteria bacterium]
MAENASIARPYAKAVFELARDNTAFSEWSGALQQLTAVATDEEFSALINDPRIEPDQLAGLLIDITGDSLPDGGENFVNLIVQNDRLEALADIQNLYTSMVAKAQQSISATVITAMPLTDDQKDTLEKALARRLGLKVNLEETVDPSLVGGAIVRAGDLVIDGSATGRIKKLASVLAR